MLTFYILIATHTDVVGSSCQCSTPANFQIQGCWIHHETGGFDCLAHKRVQFDQELDTGLYQKSHLETCWDGGFGLKQSEIQASALCSALSCGEGSGIVGAAVPASWRYPYLDLIYEKAQSYAVSLGILDDVIKFSHEWIKKFQQCHNSAHSLSTGKADRLYEVFFMRLYLSLRQSLLNILPMMCTTWMRLVSLCFLLVEMI